jgi:LemA protein
MTSAIIIVVIAVIAIIFIVNLYNGLVKLRNNVSEGWAQIDNQLKRRADLIPNLIETVKGYASHEKEVFEEVTKARSSLMSASTPSQAAAANGQLESSLKSLFAVSENYPQLKAVESFSALQEELASTENKISFARQYYNESVLAYSNKLQVFPSNLIANIFSFKPSEYFKIEEADKALPKVSF